MTEQIQDRHATHHRRISAESAYDEDALLDSKSSPHPITELGVYHDAAGFLHSDLHIRSATETLYYVQCTTNSEDGFDMTMHRGGSQTDPVVGACRFEPLSLDTMLAIGDPTSKAVKWERIAGKSLFTANFAFKTETASGLLESFEWRRSHGKDVHDAGGKWFSMRNMTLVRLSDEAILGVYVDNLFTGWPKKGKIQLRETDQLGKHGQFVVLLALLAINEKMRRKTRGTTTSLQAGGKFPV